MMYWRSPNGHSERTKGLLYIMGRPLYDHDDRKETGRISLWCCLKLLKQSNFTEKLLADIQK